MATPNPEGHYFSASPSVASRPSRVALDLPGLHLDLATDRGVFSPGAIDAGTKLLLLEAPMPGDLDPVAAGGPFLDIGCGYGPIACTLAARAPAAEVWAVDVNERALALCEANAGAAGLVHVRTSLPDGVPSELRFAGIWSNPPVRVGKAELHAVLERWLVRLAPEGRAWLVVHKHLGADSLARWLEAGGYPTTRLRSRSGYRLLEVGG